MSSDDLRNGRNRDDPTGGGGSTDAVGRTTGAEPTADVEPTTDLRSRDDDGPTETGGVPDRNEMTVALTPSQLAVGGVIVAGLLVVGARLLLGRRRRR